MAECTVAGIFELAGELQVESGYMRYSQFLLFALLTAFSAHLQAQKLYLGVMGGAGLTDGFKDRRFYYRNLSYPDIVFFTDSKDYILGATAEVQFNSNFSVEGDALFRKLHLTFAGVLPDGTLNSVSPNSAITWEFPILAKYRFGHARFRPFLEAGPSFRTAGNLNGSRPSHHGVTAGAGVETTYRGIRIAPVLRYTRWARDTPAPRPQSKPDQLEMLVGFSMAGDSPWRPWHRRVMLGALVGTGVTADFKSASRGDTTVRSGPHKIITGPSVEVDLGRNLAFEFDALYRPYRYTSITIFSDQARYEGEGTKVTWAFPLLAKYRFLRGQSMRPFVEAGPSFRLTQSLTYASPYGVTAGGGVDFRARFLHLQPTVRYTHWAANTNSYSATALRNQVEMLMGISF